MDHNVANSDGARYACCVCLISISYGHHSCLREPDIETVAQLREAMEAVASGRPWKQCADNNVQTTMFFLFCLITKFSHVLWLPMTLHSIHFAQYAHALLLTIIS